MSRKSILWIATGILLLGGIIGYLMYNKPHRDMAAAKSDVSIQAIELLKNFSEDEVKANELYLEKIITVTGKINSVKKEGEHTIVTLETGDPLSGVICNLDPLTVHKRTEFAAGESITFKGTCSGYLSDVILDRCVEINK